MIHLTELAVQRIAAALPEDHARRRHLEECTACQARVERASREREAIASDPAFARGLARVQHARGPSPVRRRPSLRLVLSATASLVAACALLFMLPRREAPQSKGIAAIYAIESTGNPTLRAHVGDLLRLEANAAGAPFAAVVTIGPEGPPEWLWPPEGQLSGAVPSDGVLVPNLLVTPGDVALVGLFSSTPLVRQDVLDRLAEPLRRLPWRDLDALEAALPPSPEGDAQRAVLVLRVDSGP